MMYHYLEEKEFLHEKRRRYGKMMQALCHCLKEDYDIGANFYLVGSGARNLILQNANNPVDLDYNLEIVRCEDFSDCRYIKECVRKSFNKVLHKYSLRDCEDSTSSLTAKEKHYKIGNNISFSVDVCIVYRGEEDAYYRLIHEKTGWTINDRYFWNKTPHTSKLKQKVNYIKEHGYWNLVREQYLQIKNKYLAKNDLKNHPSFVCYAEAVNNVYNSVYIKQKRNKAFSNGYYSIFNNCE